MVLTYIVGFVMGWFFAPAFTDISKKVWQEIKDWRGW